MLNNAFPQLKEFCDQMNIDFEAVDLRWRAGVHIDTELRATGLHFSEIERCKYASLGPHFVVLFILIVQTNVKITSNEWITTSTFYTKKFVTVNLLSIFQLLVGDKYGQGTPPLKIDAKEFKVLHSVAEHQNIKSRNLLDEWYLLDSNTQPPVYVLQVNGQKKNGFTVVIETQVSI